MQPYFSHGMDLHYSLCTYRWRNTEPVGIGTHEQLFMGYMSYILHAYPWLNYFPLAVSREYQTDVEERFSLFRCSLDPCRKFFTHILGSNIFLYSVSREYRTGVEEKSSLDTCHIFFTHILGSNIFVYLFPESIEQVQRRSLLCSAVHCIRVIHSSCLSKNGSHIFLYLFPQSIEEVQRRSLLCSAVHWIRVIHSSRISLAHIFSSICFQRVSNRCRGEIFLVQLFIGYLSHILHAYPWLKYFPLSVSREYRRSVEEKSSLFSCSLDTCIIHAYPWLKYFPLTVSREYQISVEEKSSQFSCSLDTCYTFFTHILGSNNFLYLFPESSKEVQRRSLLSSAVHWIRVIYSSHISLAQIFSSILFPESIEQVQRRSLLWIRVIHSSHISLAHIFSSICFQRVSRRCRGEVFLVQLFTIHVSYILHAYPWLTYFPLSVSREYREGAEEKSSFFCQIVKRLTSRMQFTHRKRILFKRVSQRSIQGYFAFVLLI